MGIASMEKRVKALGMGTISRAKITESAASMAHTARFFGFFRAATPPA